MHAGASKEEAHSRALELARGLSVKMQEDNFIVDIEPNRKDEYNRIELPSLSILRQLLPIPLQLQ